MRDLLRHREFRLLLAAQTLSMFGDWTLLLVLGIWAKSLTGSNAVAGLTVFAIAAPGVLAPVAGLLAWGIAATCWRLGTRHYQGAGG